MNNINIFTTDVNSISTEKNIESEMFTEETKDMKKSKLTEKFFVKSQGESKFLCLAPKFNELSIKIIVF